MKTKWFSRKLTNDPSILMTPATLHRFDARCATEDGYDYLQFFADSRRQKRLGEAKYTGRRGSWVDKAFDIEGGEFWCARTRRAGTLCK